MFVSTQKLIQHSAIAACLTVVSMFVLFLATGVGQDPLQYVHPVDEYQRLLTARPELLRLAIGLDNLFIAFYAATFAGMAIRLKELGANPLLIRIGFSALALLTLLDLVENMHFLSMIANAAAGVVVGAAEIEAQVWESLVKFHLGYVGLFIVGFALPRRTSLERLLGNLSWFVQLPVGVAIYVAPRALAVPLVMVRFSYFAVALALVAATLGRSNERSSVSSSAVGSSVPA
jgi:hypothetical protein